MSNDTKKIEVKVERSIPASLEEVFDGWLSSKVPGTVWYEAEKFLLEAKLDGFFYWLIKGTSHYGRFTEMQRPHRMQYTWVSKHTQGEESTVTVSFKKQGEETLMTLIHSGLPDTEGGRGHEGGWNYFVQAFKEQFGDGPRKEHIAGGSPCDGNKK